MNRIQNYDNMSLGDAQEIYMNIEKRIIINSYTFPKKPSADGYYRIHAHDEKRTTLCAKSIPELEERVYAFEKGINGKTRKTVKEVFEIAINQKLKYIKDPDRILSKQNTITRDRSEYKRFIAGTDFEDRFIDTISKSDVEEIIYYNLTRYELRRSGFNSLRGILRSIFQLAYYQSWIKDNVYDRIDFKKYDGMIVAAVNIEKRVHTDKELHLILDEIHKHQKEKPRYIPAYALEMQILCGCRRGEIPPLRLDDLHEKYIEISREQITVKKYNNISEYCKIVEHTKTYKDRYLPRYDALNEFLERLLKVHKEYYPHTRYLFPAESKNGVITNNTVYNYYRRICRRLGIKICKETIKGTHSFRRNAITDVVNASGGNLILAANLFGNSAIIANKNYYTGIDMNMAVEVLNKRTLS